MKTVLAVFLLAGSLSALAQENEMFQKVKGQRLSNIDKRLGYLQELKSCVSSSTDRGTMKSCDEAHKSKLKALKDSNEGFREGMKSERESRREARKKR